MLDYEESELICTSGPLAQRRQDASWLAGYLGLTTSYRVGFAPDDLHNTF
jgi:hypothetical protein